MKRMYGIVWIALAGMMLWASAGLTAQPKVGDTPPEIKAAKWFNADGEVSLAKLKGKLVVVEFWATWCPPCRKSIPHLNDIYNKVKDKGVTVIGLSDEPADKVEKFMKDINAGATKQMEYIVGAGSNDAAAYGVTGIPHAFLIGPDGKVLWVGHPMDGLDQAIERTLKSAAPKEAKPAAPAT